MRRRYFRVTDPGPGRQPACEHGARGDDLRLLRSQHGLRSGSSRRPRSSSVHRSRTAGHELVYGGGRVGLMGARRRCRARRRRTSGRLHAAGARRPRGRPSRPHRVGRHRLDAHAQGGDVRSRRRVHRPARRLRHARRGARDPDVEPDRHDRQAGRVPRRQRVLRRRCSASSTKRSRPGSCMPAHRAMAQRANDASTTRSRSRAVRRRPAPASGPTRPSAETTVARPMPILLGLFASLLIGTSDFLGARSAGRTTALQTTTAAFLGGGVAAMFYSPLLGNPAVRGHRPRRVVGRRAGDRADDAVACVRAVEHRRRGADRGGGVDRRARAVRRRRAARFRDRSDGSASRSASCALFVTSWQPAGDAVAGRA